MKTSEENLTAIYSTLAIIKALGFKIHRIGEGNKLQAIEITRERIKITIPITSDYRVIKRIIKKELEKYTFHNSITPKQYQKKINSIGEISKSYKTVKQEPLLDLNY